MIELPIKDSLFKIFAPENQIKINYENQSFVYSGAVYGLKPELTELYHKIGLLNESQNSVVIYPIFTQAAYGKQGFYDYYRKTCDSSCLTIKLPTEINGEYSANRAAYGVLRLLGYQIITDIDVDKNPEILKEYDKIILLHNEYVTRNEFDAIVKHSKVIYLYPNALYAEIRTDYDNNIMTLIRGHGFPTEEISNGFDWEYDNSNYEYDSKCLNWEFYNMNNGIMLNCYPEHIINKDATLLQKIKEY